MSIQHPETLRTKDPLHGITLKAMLEHLVKQLGWARLAEDIRIRCFAIDPSLASSLKFLRRTPWARAKIEALYLHQLGLQDSMAAHNKAQDYAGQQAVTAAKRPRQASQHDDRKVNAEIWSGTSRQKNTHN